MNRSLLGAIALSLVLPGLALAQTAVNSPTGNADEKLDAISKKVDEQNRKIDLLSQEILKLEQQLANSRPGVMIGEATPANSPTASTGESAHPQGGNSHTVARGETLTSIAKMYSVSVTELQKFNHIENDRKLQIGQTLAIPSPGAAASASPAASPSPAG
ncbi:MAG: LysM peptidoglycan-binding domain-containing protein [Chthoniobacterales bacterium]